MSTTITYRRTGRKLRSAGKIIARLHDGTCKVLPSRDGWKPIWVFPHEMLTGDDMAMPIRAKRLKPSKAKRSLSIIRKCRSVTPPTPRDLPTRLMHCFCNAAERALTITQQQ